MNVNDPHSCTTHKSLPSGPTLPNAQVIDIPGPEKLKHAIVSGGTPLLNTPEDRGDGSADGITLSTDERSLLAPVVSRCAMEDHNYRTWSIKKHVICDIRWIRC